MKKYLVPTAILAVVSALFVWVAIAAPARTAASNLEAVNSLTAGKTTEAELLGRKAFQSAPRMCIQETCFYHLEAQNRFLSALHLAPRTFIGTNVSVRGGLVQDVAVFSMTAGLRPVIILQVESLPHDCQENPCLKLPPANQLAGLRIIVDHQSEVRNHLPDAVNVQCLSRPRGCTQYAEFVPLTRDFQFEETSSGLKLRGRK